MTSPLPQRSLALPKNLPTAAMMRTAGPPVLLLVLVALVTIAEPNFFSATALSVVTAQALPIIIPASAVLGQLRENVASG